MPQLRLAPSQLEDHRIAGIGTGNSSLISYALPREGSTSLQHSSEGPQSTEGPGTHAGWGGLADQKLIANLVPKGTGTLLRYDLGYYILHLCHAVVNLFPEQMRSEVDGELAVSVE